MDEDVQGHLLEGGSYEFNCPRTGHPGGGEWSWLEVPSAPDVPGLGGLAEELNLADVLPEVVRSLGDGWFEVGLVERAYAHRDPDGFAQIVATWGHSSQGENLSYSATTYLARTLGTLGREGRVAYHGGAGTGRWKYNADISWWASVPPPSWEQRTSWTDVLGDEPDVDPCTTYVH
jgi:hypothetical protein